MARLRYLELVDLPEKDRDLLSSPINLNRILAYSPDCRRASLGLANYFRGGSRLDPRLRELAILQVSLSTQNAYEWVQHIRIGRESGVSDDDIRGLVDHHCARRTSLDDTALSVAAGAREITENGGLSEKTFSDWRRLFGVRDLVDLVSVVAYYNSVARVIASLGVDLDEDLAALLDEFALPGHGGAEGG